MGLFFFMSHGVGKQFVASLCSISVFVVIVIVVFGIVLLVPLFLFSELFSVPSACSFCFLNRRHLFPQFPVFLQCRHIGSRLWAILFVACWLTVLTCSSSGAFILFNSNSLSRCVTIFPSVLFSKWVRCIGFFRCGSTFAHMNCSMMACATIPNASLTSLWSFSRKSTNYWFARMETKLCNLFRPPPLIGVLHISRGKLPELLSNSLGLGC